jgi:hypothetical protein
MGIHSKVYIGHVETINPDVLESLSPIESKVVALKLTGFDHINKVPKYKPLRKYGEYYKVISVDNKPLTGSLGNIVDDKKINIALKKTGKQEVKQLKKVA